MYRNIELAKALSQLEILREVDDLKDQIDAMPPFTKEIAERILQKLRLDWNYHSNAIEGNPYTYGETVAFLMEGITAKGKTLNDHLDIKGHDDAIHYLLNVVNDKNYRLNEAEIRNLHKVLLKESYFSDAITADGMPTRKEIKIGSYKSSPNHVKTPTGAIHYYASPEETTIRMGELVQWFNVVSDNRDIHPVVVASLFHHEFAAIHPFDDGNGRMSRLLMNLILIQNAYPSVVIKQQNRNDYYQVLRQADAKDYRPFVEYIAGELLNSLDVILKGARGQSIEEVDDLDKEIALFKKALGKDLSQKKVDKHVIQFQVENSIVPLFKEVLMKVTGEFSDLFFETKMNMKTESRIGGGDNHQRIAEPDEIKNAISINPILYINDPSERYQIKGLQLGIRFEGFKKAKEPFNAEIHLSIKFDDFKFRITHPALEKMQVSRFYDEILTISEIQAIVKLLIKSFFLDLKSKVNKQTSRNEQEKAK
jgi:Fic family protein